MPSLPEGYTVCVCYNSDDQPCHAELRDSANGVQIGQAIWDSRLGIWYDPSGHTPGGDPDAPIEIPTTLAAWLKQRELRGDEPAF